MELDWTFTRTIDKNSSFALMACDRALDKRGDENNAKTFFHFSVKNVNCNSLLEPSRRDGSNEGSQCMYFLWNNEDNYS